MSTKSPIVENSDEFKTYLCCFVNCPNDVDCLCEKEEANQAGQDAASTAVADKVTRNNKLQSMRLISQF